MRSTTPVIILAGRLGAGKTTLLNHVLRHAGDRRFGVIVNDFGAVNVDALMVARQVDGVVGIGNGCVCCATDSDGFEDSVTRLVRTGVDAVLVEASGIADPRSMIRRVVAMADPIVAYGGLVYVVDAVLVEASGIADPRSMIRRVVAMADPIVAYGGLVYVVDAATGDAVLPREVLAHARVADLLVVNKADLVDAGCVTSIGDRLVAVNATAPRVITAEGALDPALLVDAAARADVAGPEQLTLDALLRDAAGADRGGRAPIRHDYEQYTWESAGAVNPRAVARLLERPPAGCYRIKGWVRVESDFYAGSLEFSAVGGRIRAARRPARDHAGAAANVLVLIGIGMDQAQARADCAALTDVTADDEFGALSLLRYDPATVAAPGDASVGDVSAG